MRLARSELTVLEGAKGTNVCPIFCHKLASLNPDLFPGFFEWLCLFASLSVPSGCRGSSFGLQLMAFLERVFHC
jgi:hypothetical protein